MIVVVLVPAVELLHVTIFDMGVQKPRIFNIPWIIIELYRILGYFALGALCTLLTTELAKYKIGTYTIVSGPSILCVSVRNDDNHSSCPNSGRLRPYFFSVCKANLDDDLCKDENDFNIFVTDYDCPGKDNPPETTLHSRMTIRVAIHR